MNFEWAVKQMKAGKKVRCKSWASPNSYIFVKDNLVCSHKDTKAYFFFDSFEATDWEIFDDFDLNKIIKKISNGKAGVMPCKSSMETADKEGKFYCQKCKTEVKFGQKFCTNCGRAQMWALFG